MKNDNIQPIPLRALARSDKNTRSVQAPEEAMQELEASIAAHGVLENLVVRERQDGRRKTYEVIAGGRRLTALQRLARKRRSGITLSTPIPCRIIDEDAVDEELSLTENATRVDMHPVDQVAAFRKLTENGLTSKAIANRFGLTARTVEQGLRLAGVAPEILEEARADRLALDHLQAFASTPDQTRQMAVWNRMKNQGYAPGPHWIRSELRDNLMCAASGRVRFVGLDAYKAAGGRVEVDLFGEDDERNVQVLDADLLDRLAAEKLEAAGREHSEGWRWIETRLELEWNAADRFGRLQGHPEPPAPEDEALAAKLSEEMTGIEHRLEHPPEDHDDLDDEQKRALTARYDELDARLEQLQIDMRDRVSYSPEQKACAGCLLSIDEDGELVLHQGLVRPEDEHLVPSPATTRPPDEPLPSRPDGRDAPPEDGPPAHDEPIRPAPGAPPSPQKPQYTPPRCDDRKPNPETAAAHDAGLRVAVANDLRLIRTALVKAHLALDFDCAFDLITYQMVTTLFDTRARRAASPTAISVVNTPDLPAGLAPGDRDAFTAENPGIALQDANRNQLRLDWTERQDDRERFEAFRALPLEARRDLFAAAVARCIHPQLAFDPAACAATEAAIESLDIPFHSLYRPGLDRFWRRLARRELLEIATATLGEDWANGHQNDRKGDLAQALADAFAKDGQLPDIDPEKRARALEWAPAGFRPNDAPAPPSTEPEEPGPPAEPGDSEPGGGFDHTPSASVPGWMQS